MHKWFTYFKYLLSSLLSYSGIIKDCGYTIISYKISYTLTGTPQLLVQDHDDYTIKIYILTIPSTCTPQGIVQHE